MISSKNGAAIKGFEAFSNPNTDLYSLDVTPQFIFTFSINIKKHLPLLFFRQVHAISRSLSFNLLMTKWYNSAPSGGMTAVSSVIVIFCANEISGFSSIPGAN